MILQNMKNKEKKFAVLLLTSLSCMAFFVILNNRHEQTIQQIDVSERNPREPDLTLPSIYQWLPNTQMKPESLVPKFKISKDR